MAKLILPGDNKQGDIPQNNGISITAAGQSILPLTQAGDAQIKMGQQLMQEGQQYFDKAQKAIDTSIANDRYSGAAKEFNRRAQERMSKPYNEDGSPNFQTLSSDLQKIGDEVGAKYGAGIFSMDAANSFNTSFNNLVSNKVLQAGETSRQQLMDYGRGKLIERMDTNLQMAQSDPMNIDLHVADTNEAISQAMSAGYIDAETAAKMRLQANSHIRNSTYEVLNSQNPQVLRQILMTQSEAQLGISPEEKARLIDLNTKKLGDLEHENKVKQAEQLQVVKAQQQFNSEQVELGIVQGTIGDAELKQLYDEGKINHTQYTKHQMKLFEARGQTIKNIATTQAITQSIADGEPLYTKFSQEEINDYYKKKISLAKDPKTGQMPSLLQRAPMVADMNAPVTAFSNELKMATIGNDPRQFLEAAKAYQFVAQKNPIAVSSLDSKTRAAFITTNLMIGNLPKNTDPATVVKHVQDTIINADNQVASVRAEQFKSLDEFKPNKGLNKSINKALGIDWSLNDAPQNVKDEAAALLREGYMMTGDADKAIAYAKEGLSGRYGTSEVNSVPSRGIDPKIVTLYPPEHVFNKQATTEELRQDINIEVSQLLQERNIQIDPNLVYVKGDAGTEIAVNSNKTPTYGLYYKDQNGVEIALTDETGMAMRWTPNLSQIRARREEAAMQKQTAETVAALQKAGTLNAVSQALTGTIPKGITKEGDVHFQRVSKDGQTDNYFVNSKTGELSSQNTMNFGAKGEFPKMFNQNVMPRDAHPQLEETAYAILNVESSGGDYSLRTPAGKGRTALGAYQILDVYVDDFSKEVLGKAVSVREFMNSPALQDKIALGMINKYLKQGGSPEEAMSRWFTGRDLKSARASGNKDKFGTTVDDYINKGNKFRGLYNSNADKGVGKMIKESAKADATPLTLAGAYLGTNEKKHREVLAGTFRKILGKNIDPSSTPWCAAFVSAVLKEGGYSGSKGQLSAREYLNVGEAVNKPSKGDIVVLSRGNDQSKGHVGFYAGEKNGKILVLGGNQNDSVSIKEYPLSAVLGYRRPTKLALDDNPSKLLHPDPRKPKPTPPNGGISV